MGISFINVSFYIGIRGKVIYDTRKFNIFLDSLKTHNVLKVRSSFYKHEFSIVIIKIPQVFIIVLLYFQLFYSFFLINL